MTAIADTRFLLTLEFPPTQEAKSKIEALLHRELSHRIFIPAIVLTEFLKIAGSRIGEEAALTRIRILKNRGAGILPLGESQALSAGKLLLEHPHVPIADALVAAFVTKHGVDYVLTDDPHFETLGAQTRWI